MHGMNGNETVREAETDLESARERSEQRHMECDERAEEVDSRRTRRTHTKIGQLAVA